MEELYEGASNQVQLKEREDEVNHEKIGEPIMEEEFKKAMQQLKDMKAPRIDDVPTELIKKSGDGGIGTFRLVGEIYLRFHKVCL